MAFKVKCDHCGNVVESSISGYSHDPRFTSGVVFVCTCPEAVRAREAQHRRDAELRNHKNQANSTVRSHRSDPIVRPAKISEKT